MKKWLWIPILIIVLIVFCCQKQEKVEQTETETKNIVGEIPAIAQKVAVNLDLAVESLAKGQMSDGAGLLLDTVLLVKPHEQWPEGFVDHIAAAKEHFASDNFTDGAGNVSAALDLIKTSVETEPSEEGGEIASIATLIKDEIEKSKEMFKKGDVNQGVASILEVLQRFAPNTN